MKHGIFTGARAEVEDAGVRTSLDLVDESSTVLDKFVDFLISEVGL